MVYYFYQIALVPCSSVDELLAALRTHLGITFSKREDPIAGTDIRAAKILAIPATASVPASQGPLPPLNAASPVYALLWHDILRVCFPLRVSNLKLTSETPRI